ncbi:MAG: glycosyltransferase family 4 protein [Phycisphaerae bacterium]|nr:glycosyltransferase family 4 protein [Phycisphaerae bacterium]
MASGCHVHMIVDEDCMDRFGSAIRRLCVGLIDDAIPTTIIGPSSPSMDSLRIGPVRVESHGALTWWRRNRALADLVSRLGSNPPDIVHAFSGATAELGGHLAGAFDAPLVVTLTGRDELTDETEAFLNSAATLVAVSDPVRAETIQRLERSAEDVVLVRWGLTAGKEPSCFADEDKSLTLVTICPLAADMGLEHLIDAMAQLVRGPKPIMLFVLGVGPAEIRLRERANRLGLNQHVTFVGPIREWPKVLDGADLFIEPVAQHRLTIHPIAAMAAGVVVVAAEGSDHDCLIEGQTARLYHAQSAELLAAVCAEVLGDPARSRALAANAQRYVSEHHRISAMVAETTQLYRQLALNQDTIRIPPA